MQRYIKTAPDVERDQIILREISEVAGEAVQRVVLRVDGPDDFIHRAGQFARSVVNAVELRRGLRGIFQFALRGLAQQRDAREVGAQMIVDVLGNAGALAFERLLLFEAFQLAPQPATGNEPNRSEEHTSELQSPC